MLLQPQNVTLDTEWIIRVKDYTNPFTKFFLLLNKIKNLIDIEIEIIRKPSNGCSSDLNQKKTWQNVTTLSVALLSFTIAECMAPRFTVRLSERLSVIWFDF